MKVNLVPPAHPYEGGLMPKFLFIPPKTLGEKTAAERLPEEVEVDWDDLVSLYREKYLRYKVAEVIFDPEDQGEALFPLLKNSHPQEIRILHGLEGK